MDYVNLCILRTTDITHYLCIYASIFKLNRIKQMATLNHLTFYATRFTKTVSHRNKVTRFPESSIHGEIKICIMASFLCSHCTFLKILAGDALQFGFFSVFRSSSHVVVYSLQMFAYNFKF